MTPGHEGARRGPGPVPTSPPHGFCDDEQTRRLLRSRPPARALDWVGQVVGGTIGSTRALKGGMSSAMHLVAVRRARGGLERVVLRRYVRPELNLEGPGTAGREATVLRFAESVELPTPRLLAVDPEGEASGAPAVLMSRLPGRVDWWPTDIDGWLVRLAELLPVIHSTALPRPGALCSFEPYAQDRYDPPPWTRRPGLWERAVEIFHGPAPDLDRVFIQRDFHPGNVLWQKGRVTGVVDWQAACIGPAAADVAHCRSNLLRYGLDVADRFRSTWEQLTGREYHPWLEVVTIIGFLDGLHDDPPSDSLAMEEALGRALAELG